MIMLMKVKYNRKLGMFTGTAEYLSKTVDSQKVTAASDDFFECCRLLVEEAEIEFGSDVDLHSCGG